MIDFLILGGTTITIPLTALFVASFILVIRSAILILKSKFKNPESALQSIRNIKFLGIISLCIGILGQIIGVYEAFMTIENWGSVKPLYLFSGLRISSISTIYGIFIFTFSYISWIALKIAINRQLS